jgi:alkyl hydroperoxide reductase subunit AhpF
VNVLGEREREAVASVLASLEQDVNVTLELGPAAAPVTLLAAGGGEIDPGDQTRAILEDVCSLSERITLEVVERDEPGPWPRTTIGPGLRYLGMPLGYELTTLVHGIVEAARREPSLTAASRERLGGLERDVAIDVYVTPT